MDVQLCMHWLKHPMLDTLNISPRGGKLCVASTAGYFLSSPSPASCARKIYRGFTEQPLYWGGKLFCISIRREMVGGCSQHRFIFLSISSKCYFSFPSLVPSIPTQLASTLAAPSSIIKDMAAFSSSIIKGRPFPSSRHLISTATALLVLCFKN